MRGAARETQGVAFPMQHWKNTSTVDLTVIQLHQEPGQNREEIVAQCGGGGTVSTYVIF